MPSPVHAATITKVQGALLPSFSLSSSLNVTMSSASTAGNLLVVVLSGSGTFSTTVPGWVSARAQVGAANSQGAAIWYYPNNPGGITSVLFTSTVGTALAGEMSEWSGVARSSPLDATNSTTSATATTGYTLAITPSLSNELVLTDYSWFKSGGGGSWTNGTGWTNLSQATISNYALGSDYNLGLASGAQSETVSEGVAGTWAAVGVTFKPEPYSIANITPSSGTSAITAGTFDGTLPALDWSDSTAAGSSWHGTVAVTLLNDTGTWVKTGGSHTLTVATSGTYTGTASQGYYIVSVTADTGSAVTAAVSGSETATISAGAHNAALAVGTKGVTITFATGTTYANGDKFTIHVGNLPASAMTLRTTSGSITVLSGSETATLQNNAVTVTGGTPSTVGSAVSFVTASGASASSFHVVPGARITYDSNNVWAAAYVATISYTIVSGP
jgi:hypothetical protein